MAGNESPSKRWYLVWMAVGAAIAVGGMRGWEALTTPPALTAEVKDALPAGQLESQATRQPFAFDEPDSSHLPSSIDTAGPLAFPHLEADDVTLTAPVSPVLGDATPCESRPTEGDNQPEPGLVVVPHQTIPLQPLPAPASNAPQKPLPTPFPEENLIASPHPTEVTPQRVPTSSSPSGRINWDQLIQEELPGLTRDEVNIWKEELRSLPEEMARDILRIRKHFGANRGDTPSEPTRQEVAVPRDGEQVDPLLTDQPGNAAAPLTPLPFTPLVPQHPSPRSPRSESDGSPSQLAAQMVTLLEAAREKTLLDLANARVPGYRPHQIVWSPIEPVLVTGPQPRSAVLTRPFTDSTDDRQPDPPGEITSSLPHRSAADQPTIRINEDSPPLHSPQHLKTRRSPLQMMKPLATRLQIENGPLAKTNRPLDVAIVGPGWIAVNAGEIRYTRCGRLVIQRGKLAVQCGHEVHPLAHPIPIPETAFGLEISEDGLVSAVLGDEAKAETIGQILLTTFQDATQLKRDAHGLFRRGELSGSSRLLPPGSRLVGKLQAEHLETTGLKTAELHQRLAELEIELAWWQGELNSSGDRVPQPLAEVPGDRTARSRSATGTTARSVALRHTKNSRFPMHFETPVTPRHSQQPVEIPAATAAPARLNVPRGLIQEYLTLQRILLEQPQLHHAAGKKRLKNSAARQTATSKAQPRIRLTHPRPLQQPARAETWIGRVPARAESKR